MTESVSSLAISTNCSSSAASGVGVFSSFSTAGSTAASGVGTSSSVVGSVSAGAAGAAGAAWLSSVWAAESELRIRLQSSVTGLNWTGSQ